MEDYDVALNLDTGTEGWFKPERARKWHYFKMDNKSYCGGHKMASGVKEEHELGDQPHFCKACNAKVKREKMAMLKMVTDLAMLGVPIPPKVLIEFNPFFSRYRKNELISLLAEEGDS